MSRHLVLCASALAAAFAIDSPAAAIPPGQTIATGHDQSSYLRIEDYRVAAVAYRLALAHASQCDDRYPLTGLLLHHLPEYEGANREFAIERHQLDRGPGVLAVIGNSPAARAGLLAGDVLLAVNSRSFPSPIAMAEEEERETWRAMIEASERQLETQLRRGPARLDILRDGQPLTIYLTSESGCPGRIRLARSTQPNAFANGRYVIITTELLDFVRNDDELAVVIAHELAHNILAHPAQLREQEVPRSGLLRFFGKNASRIRATEEEADRLAARLVWSAGYDVSAAIPFWRRYYDHYGGPGILSTHPRLDDRERFIREEIEIIRTGLSGR